MLRISEKPYIVFAFLFLISFAAYGWCMKYFFVSDDFLLLEDAYSTWNHANFFSLLYYPLITFGNGFWRPFFNGGKNILYFFLGESAVSFHIVSIGLHALNGFLIWHFLNVRNKNRWNVCAPLLFAVYPVAWQAVAWISTMSDLLVTACMLGAGILYLRYEQSASLKSLVAAGWLGVSAMLFKESGIVVIPVLGLLFAEGMGQRSGQKRNWPIEISFFVALGLSLIVYVLFTLKHIRSAAGVLPEHSFSPLLMTRTLSYYLLYLAQPFAFIPFPSEGTVRDFLLWYRGTSSGLIAASSIAMVFLISAIWSSPRYRLYILWILISLLPSSTFTDYQSSRYLYIATVPFCMLVNEGLKNWVWEGNGQLNLRIKPAFGVALGGLLILFILTNWSSSGKYDFILIHDQTQKFLKQLNRLIPGNIPDYEVWWVEEKPNPVPFIQHLLNRTNRRKKCRKISYFTKEEYERERIAYQRAERVAVILNGRKIVPLSYDPAEDCSGIREKVPFQEMEIPVGTVIVTDDRRTTDNLVGKIDPDSRDERALAIRWNFGDSVYSAYHLYVKEDRYTQEFLVSIPPSQKGYEWYPGNPNNAPLLMGGPRLEREYRFILFGITPEGKIEKLETTKSVWMRVECP